MKATLYDLAAEFRDTAEKLMDSDMPEEVVRDTLEGCAMDFDNKAVAVASLIRNMESAAEAIKQAEQEQARRRKALEARAEHLRNYLMANMNNIGRTKIECPLFKIAVQNNPASVMIDGEIPEDYMVFPEPPPPPPPHPDKAAIKAAIEAGRDVPNARLVRGQRLVIK